MTTATRTTSAADLSSASTLSVIYSWDVWYRYESDSDRSVRSIPQMSCGSFDTFYARESDILRRCEEMRLQGYEIQKIERTEACAKCSGSGRIKGKKFMQFVPCPSCQSEAIAVAKRLKANAAAKAKRNAYASVGMKKTRFWRLE